MFAKRRVLLSCISCIILIFIQCLDLDLDHGSVLIDWFQILSQKQLWCCCYCVLSDRSCLYRLVCRYWYKKWRRSLKSTPMKSSHRLDRPSWFEKRSARRFLLHATFNSTQNTKQQALLLPLYSHNPLINTSVTVPSIHSINHSFDLRKKA